MKSYNNILKNLLQKYKRRIHWYKYEPIHLIKALYKEVMDDMKRIKSKF